MREIGRKPIAEEPHARRCDAVAALPDIIFGDRASCCAGPAARRRPSAHPVGRRRFRTHAAADRDGGAAPPWCRPCRPCPAVPVACRTRGMRRPQPACRAVLTSCSFGVTQNGRPDSSNPKTSGVPPADEETVRDSDLDEWHQEFVHAEICLPLPSERPVGPKNSRVAFGSGGMNLPSTTCSRDFLERGDFLAAGGRRLCRTRS